MSSCTPIRSCAGRLLLLASLCFWLALTAVAQAAPLDPAPVDCVGPAGDPEAGTAEWEARDRANVICGEQRLVDSALHPVGPLPAQYPVFDAYREPSRHDGRRFRFYSTTVTNRNGVELEVEVYRPCAAGTCSATPAGLKTFEPPYPAVLVMHGGYQSRKELHWWATQALAEAGYMTVSLNAIHADDMFYEDSRDVLEWFTATPGRTTATGGYNPFWQELDPNRLGVAGHSGGGATANRHGNTDPRFKAVVGWDRSGRYDLPDELRVPSLFLVADHGFTPERRDSPPDPDGYEEGSVDRGDKFQDFDRFREAGLDSMKIALRAATHLDWVPNVSAASRYGEAVSVYYTLAWFDRYLKGDEDPRLAADAFARLTADEFDASADLHNISQGLFDPVLAAQSADPYGGNVPYALNGMSVADRLSFYFHSKCFIRPPGGTEHLVSDDMRTRGCRRAGDAGATDPGERGSEGGASPDSASGTEGQGAPARKRAKRATERRGDGPSERETSGTEATTTGAQSGALPFTGLQLALLVLLGMLLAGGGWVIRRVATPGKDGAR